MKSKCLILTAIILSGNLLAKGPIGLVMSKSNTNCRFGWSLMLSDYNKDNSYDKAYLYNCYQILVKDCPVRENYNLSDVPGYYYGELISGSYESNDFVCIISENKSNTSVAKLFYLAVDNTIVIDPLSKSGGSSEGFVDKMDDYFSILISKTGIINLTKKKDFTVEQIIVTDINSKQVAQVQYDEYSYYIDLSLYAQGIYFISIVTNEGYLKKRILLVKD